VFRGKNGKNRIKEEKSGIDAAFPSGATFDNRPEASLWFREKRG
jgi:hypothetical protein